MLIGPLFMWSQKWVNRNLIIKNWTKYSKILITWISNQYSKNNVNHREYPLTCLTSYPLQEIRPNLWKLITIKTMNKVSIHFNKLMKNSLNLAKPQDRVVLEGKVHRSITTSIASWKVPSIKRQEVDSRKFLLRILWPTTTFGRSKIQLTALCSARIFRCRL